MTVLSTVDRVEYAGNNVTTKFTIPFYFILNADVVIYLYNLAGNTVLQVLTTDYTLTGEGVQAGGEVTMLAAPKAGETLIIYRNAPLTQGTDLVENDAAPAESIEKVFDKLTMLCQRLSTRINRSFVLADTDISGASTVIPTPSALKALRWNSGATALENYDPTSVSGASFPGSNGIAVYTGSSTLISRTLTGSGRVAVTNGTGVSGNPTLDLVALGVSDTYLAARAYAAKVATYTVTDADDYLEFSGTYTVNLHAVASAKKKPYTFVNTGSGQITLDGAASETIQGSTTRILMTQYESVTLFPNGTTWIVLSHQCDTVMTSYTPTITGFGTVSGNTGFWRRVGDVAELYVTWVNGTVAASIASISMPSGLTIDSSKLTLVNSTAAPGTLIGVWAHDSNANEIGHLVTAPSTSTTVIYLAHTDTAGSGKLTPKNGSDIMSNGNQVGAKFSVPILNWWV